MKTAVHSPNIAAEIVDILASYGVKAVRVPTPNGYAVEALTITTWHVSSFP